MIRSLTWFREGQVVEGTNQGASYRLDADYEFVGVYLNAKTAPTGRNLVVDINMDGSTLFDTLKPSLAINGTSDIYESPLNTLTVLPKDSVITMDVDYAGNEESGRDLTVQLDLELVSEE